MASSAAQRRSDRVSLTLLLEASGKDVNDQEFTLPARTMQINRTGAVILLERDLRADQRIEIRRLAPSEAHRHTQIRIVGQFGLQKEGYVYGVEILDPQSDIWNIEFPPIAESEEAVARMLLECTYCRTREVVYLNELELKSFEVRKCVARLCKHCDTPSIWIEAQAEIKSQEKGAANQLTVEERVIPRRNRTRVKARVLACIRRRGFQEEVAVCEDLSKGGLSFRSRNEYPEGSRVEVAVPFTPGSGAIFVPIRIVFSQAIPAAGLYRHGAAYIRPPSDSAD